MAVLGDDHLDAIAFTGGIGENSAKHVREFSLKSLKNYLALKSITKRNLVTSFW